MPSNETGAALGKIAAIADTIARQVDLDRLHADCCRSAPALSRLTPSAQSSRMLRRLSVQPSPRPLSERARAVKIRLGIARDEAFGFYYPGDLEALRAAGAELVPFNTLRDKHLPEVDALFIGGGFPEVHLEALAANLGLKREITRRHRSRPARLCRMRRPHVPVASVALGRTRGRNGRRDPGRHRDARQAPGTRLRSIARNRFGSLAAHPSGRCPAEIPAHEFHYSSLDNLPANLTYAYEMTRGHGLDGRHDGIVHKNLLACYCHLRDLEGNHWAARFVEFARRYIPARQAHR